MKFIQKHWRSIALTSLLALVISAAGIIVWAGSEIASPSRREFNASHSEYLEHPAAHGMTIDSFTASDGTPCLVCTPTGNLAKRGTIIRRQLTARGLTLEAPGEIIGTLVLVHGRKGRKEDYFAIAERFCAVGFRCVIPDMPAHGDNPAPIATYGVREADIPARILAEASEHFSFSPQPVGLLGMSMGGSVAIHAADQPDSPWKALAIISSFDSLPAVIEGQASRTIGSTLGQPWANATGAVYQWQSGIKLGDIQPHLHAAHLTLPTLIAHGTADRAITLSAGKRLYDSLPATTEKRWIPIPGADHDNVLITDYPIYADLAEWMLSHVPRDPTKPGVDQTRQSH
jgi:alpha-beta hydrolase superfamily lysophospholipase